VNIVEVLSIIYFILFLDFKNFFWAESESVEFNRGQEYKILSLQF
jgi:hypothetical protein